MTDLNVIPLEDNFHTTLAQSWDGSSGTVYVNDTPNFTFPSGVTTYIVVNPGKTNMQVAEIDAYDSALWTMDVTATSVNSSAWVAYSAQSHSVGSIVRISDNYQFWEDIRTAINSKVDSNDQIDFDYYATVAARDAAIPSPTIGKDYAYCLDTDLLYQYTGSGWVAFETGTVTANASTTVSGKVELATTAEFTAGTDTGGTGASLSVLPSDIQASKQSGEATYAGASAVGTDAYAVTMTPTLTAYTTGMEISFLADVANTWACTIDIDTLWATSIKTLDGEDPKDNAIRANQIVSLKYDGTNMILQNETIEMATDAEFYTWTDQTRYANAYQIMSLFQIVAWSNVFASADTERSVLWVTYTKVKEITIEKAWTYTIDFDLRNWWSNTWYGRVYKDWVAFGIEQSQATDTYTTKSENLTFAAWDLCQLYLKHSWAWGTAYAENFRVKWALEVDPEGIPDAYIGTVDTD